MRTLIFIALALNSALYLKMHADHVIRDLIDGSNGLLHDSDFSYNEEDHTLSHDSLTYSISGDSYELHSSDFYLSCDDIKLE